LNLTSFTLTACKAMSNKTMTFSISQYQLIIQIYISLYLAPTEFLVTSLFAVVILSILAT